MSTALSDSLHIRPARAADVEPLGALWQAFMEVQGRLVPEAAPAEDALVRWRNDFPVWLEDERIRLLVAEQGDRLVGFAAAQRWAPPPIYAGADEVYLNELYVAPRARHRGVGTRLVKAIEAWAEVQGAAGLRLSVLAANADARAFWERHRLRAFSLVLRKPLDGVQETSPRRLGKLGFR